MRICAKFSLLINIVFVVIKSIRATDGMNYIVAVPYDYLGYHSCDGLEGLYNLDYFF